jgi:hypothetical protein
MTAQHESEGVFSNFVRVMTSLLPDSCLSEPKTAIGCHGYTCHSEITSSKARAKDVLCSFPLRGIAATRESETSNNFVATIRSLRQNSAAESDVARAP